MSTALPSSVQDVLEALQQAVTAELDRKARLGHYAVIWQDGRAVMQGPDAPQAPGELAAMDPVDGEP